MLKKNSPKALLLPGLSPKQQEQSGPSVLGIDEVGRGCLAGPVVACATLLREDCTLDALTDSKKLSPTTRLALTPNIMQQAYAWGLGVVWPERIDALNILQATFTAMSLAIKHLVQASLEKHSLSWQEEAWGHEPLLSKPPFFQEEFSGKGSCCQDFCLADKITVYVDGNKTLPESLFLEGTALAPQTLWQQKAIVQGDSQVQAISAASVLAKTWRDAFMSAMEAVYGGYGFAEHKGYGTKQHYAHLHALGPCPLHRRSFKGVV